MKRLQGKSYYDMKPELKLVEYQVIKSTGHVKGTYINKKTGESFIHWLSDEEIKNLDYALKEVKDDQDH